MYGCNKTQTMYIFHTSPMKIQKKHEKLCLTAKPQSLSSCMPILESQIQYNQETA